MKRRATAKRRGGDLPDDMREYLLYGGKMPGLQHVFGNHDEGMPVASCWEYWQKYKGRLCAEYEHEHHGELPFGWHEYERPSRGRR